MSMPVFMKIDTQDHGPIEGACDLAGLEGTTEVYAINHIVEIPRSKSTGRPTGRRVHNDFTINKHIDKTTPLLYQTLCMGEKLTEVTFSWYRYGGDSGEMEEFYKIRLENAVVTCIKPWTTYDKDPVNEESDQLESVSFAYEKIVWEWIDGVEYEDSWIDPEGA
ncbi:MAG: type VI secretion system tube protein Hcp [Deltaproteobacteria bacterium]|nr:type VI secretion system tube protein Hcp [Deltaproteobacteria bacterium]